MVNVGAYVSAHHRALVHHHLDANTGTVASSPRHAVVTDHYATILDNATGVVLFTVMISVQLLVLNVTTAIVLVTFCLSAAVADVVIIMTEGTPLPSIQRAAEELTYKLCRP